MKGEFKKLTLLILLLLLIVTVTASPLEITTKRFKDRVLPGEEVSFILTIKNNQIRDDTFRITADAFSIAPFSDVASSIIAEPSQITITTGAEREVVVTIKLLDNMKPDKNYISNIWVKSMTKPEVKVKYPLSTFIISPKKLIEIRPEIPDEVVPGRKQQFKVNFKNNANFALEDIDIHFTSSIYTHETTLSFFPFQTITKEFRFDIDPTTEAGKYLLTIRGFQDQNIKGITTVDLNIVKNIELKEKTLTEKSFLKSVTTIVKTNEGNTPVKKTIKYPISFLKRMFTTTEPKGEIIKEDKTYYKWEFDIEPGTAKTIEITTSYRALFAIIVVIISSILLFNYWKKKSVAIEKSIFKVKDEKKGTSELKILLHIKNRTEKELHNLKVIDLLPTYIKPTEDFGTLKPDRIQKGRTGMRLIWNIPDLEPNEERVISYKVHSKLHVVGEIYLPPASIQYRAKKDRVVNIRSNRAVFSPPK